jgi:hypothetical protein
MNPTQPEVSPVDSADTLTRAEMDALITAGRAQPWTEPIRMLTPVAATVEGTWWVVLSNKPDVYQPAPAPLAAELDQSYAALQAYRDTR